MPDTFRAELYRYVGNVGDNVGNVGDNVGNVGDIKDAVLSIISNNNRITATEMAKDLSVTKRTVERYIKELRDEGRLVRKGSARGGYWEIVS